MRVIGIDPGAGGGLCELDDSSGRVRARAWCMPMQDKEVFTPAVRDILDGADLVCIERVSAMPKQGVVSVFTFGRGYGKLIGIAEAMGIPLMFVRPQDWQKEIDVPAKAGKDATSAWAFRRYPDIACDATLRSGRIHDGMTDAAGIAHYGWTHGQ